MTAMVALRAAQAAGGLRVETDAEGAVVRINATHTDDTHVWRLYRNGSLVPGVLGRVMIDPGDILLLRSPLLRKRFFLYNGCMTRWAFRQGNARSVRHRIGGFTAIEMVVVVGII